MEKAKKIYKHSFGKIYFKRLIDDFIKHQRLINNLITIMDNAVIGQYKENVKLLDDFTDDCIKNRNNSNNKFIRKGICSIINKQVKKNEKTT